MYLHCRFWGATSRSVVDAGIVGLAHEILVGAWQCRSANMLVEFEPDELLPVGEHRESQRVAENAVHLANVHRSRRDQKENTLLI